MSSSYDSAMVDTALIEDGRLLRLTRGIRLVHLEAIVWSKARLEDGAIATGALRRLTDEDNPVHAAAELVRVGLWAVTEDGWQIVDFTEHQMSAERVKAKKDAAKERYDRWQANGAKRVANATANDPARPPARPARKGRWQKGGKPDGAAAPDGAAPPSTRCIDCATDLNDLRGYGTEDAPLCFDCSEERRPKPKLMLTTDALAKAREAIDPAVFGKSR